MTSEEIKESTSMHDVLRMYGLQSNRAGMCSCPWHKDKKPSMKIFKDGFKCFSCNADGDIFKFVQLMENCSFKDAYIKLGGTYKSRTDVQHILIRRKFAERKQDKEKIVESDEQFKKILLSTINMLKVIDIYSKPFSDIWTWANNKLCFLQGAWEEKFLYEREVNEADVYRICQQVKHRIDSL